MHDQIAARKAQTRAIFDRIAPDYDAGGPGCFAHFGRRLVEAAGVAPGQRVLDVATGRGAVLLPAAALVGPAGTGEVVGVDLAEGMVRLTGAEIARRGLPARVLAMDAEALDFPDAAFDRVTCGFGVMFFPDLARALREFARVLKPGGRIGLSTWQIGQVTDLAIVLDRAGLAEAERDPALSFDTPPTVADPLAAAGFAEIAVRADTADFIYADADDYWQAARGTGLRRRLDALDPAQTAQVRAALADHLRPHHQADGIHLPAIALLATAVKPG